MILEVERLKSNSRRGAARSPPLDEISFSIAPGEVLGVVGESGAGKSITGSRSSGCSSRRGASPRARCGWRAGASTTCRTRSCAPARPQDRRHLSGPLTSLNPLYTIGRQLEETILTHLPMTKAQARARAISLLPRSRHAGARVALRRLSDQFSGGMRQRVVIALALAAEPRLLIADEPTTALDVSIQAQIIALLKRLAAERGAAVMLITHDMGVIAETAHRVAVMYAGRLVEVGAVRDVIHSPRHPYTVGLMGSIRASPPKRGRLVQIDGAMPRLNAIPPGCRLQSALPAALRPLPGTAPRPDARRGEPGGLLAACAA